MPSSFGALAYLDYAPTAFIPLQRIFRFRGEYFDSSVGRAVQNGRSPVTESAAAIFVGTAIGFIFREAILELLNAPALGPRSRRRLPLIGSHSSALRPCASLNDSGISAFIPQPEFLWPGIFSRDTRSSMPNAIREERIATKGEACASLVQLLIRRKCWCGPVGGTSSSSQVSAASSSCRASACDRMPLRGAGAAQLRRSARPRRRQAAKRPATSTSSSSQTPTGGSKGRP
jgi:hypothetical protein